MNNYIEEDDEEVADKVEPLKDQRKVTFGEVADMAISNHIVSNN